MQIEMVGMHGNTVIAKIIDGNRRCQMCRGEQIVGTPIAQFAIYSPCVMVAYLCIHHTTEVFGPITVMKE